MVATYVASPALIPYYRKVLRPALARLSKRTRCRLDGVPSAVTNNRGLELSRLGHGVFNNFSTATKAGNTYFRGIGEAACDGKGIPTR